MDHNKTELKSQEEANNTDRRDAIRKLGTFALYAAPFTMLLKAKGSAGGSGSSTGPSSVPKGKR